MMERLDAPWLQDPAVRAVIDALGHEESRFVGGVVRDSLLGRPVSDIDIATRLRPEAALARLEAAGLKVAPTGLSHGTITAISGHRPFEVTTLRRDIETFGRHARVDFCDDWKMDAARRDFTMNALYADSEGAVSDYFGGIEDALAGRVRFIGAPQDRIREDALRILRFFRFHARFGKGEPDRAGLAACAGSVSMLDILSIERVRDEMLKLLGASDPLPVLRAMEGIAILDHVLAEARDSGWRETLPGLVDREQRLGRPDALRRLALMVGRAEERLAAIGRRYRLSNRERRRLIAMSAEAPPAATDLRTAWRDGEEAVIDRLLLDGPGDCGALKRRIARLEQWRRPAFPVKGKDIGSLGLSPGPAMGALLNKLETLWIESDFSLDRAALLEKAKAREC